MDEDQKEYFSVDKNVFFELSQARNSFNKSTTFDQFESLIKGLMIMSIYCNENLVSLVESTISEVQQRQVFAKITHAEAVE